MRSTAILALAFLLNPVLIPGSARAQVKPAGTDERLSAAVVDALEEWRDAFRSGYMRPQETIRPGVDQVVYGSLVAPGGLLEDAVGRSSNGAALARLLALARDGGVRAARAMLGIAAVSHAQRLTDPQAYEVRELGHWALMRAMHDDAVRAMLYRVADGSEVFDGFGEVRNKTPDAGVVIADDRPITTRVAAIAALGLRRDEPTRRIVEAQLADADERIRLAAAESLGTMRMRDSSNVVVMALRTEVHPVVAQALVVALDRILSKHRDDPPQVIRARMVHTALQRLGETGWRTDIALVTLAERNPALESIPLMIRVLEGSPSDDPLVQAINAKASPFLKQRAWRTLCRLTGALLPEDDPAAWRRFWEDQKDEIVLPPDPVLAESRIKTHSGFFGIPITGREIAIIIDTSGSMNTAIDVEDRRRAARGTRSGRSALPRSRSSTRLDLAKHELLRAVHAMPKESRYHLLTFASDVVTWNDAPVAPTPASYRALTDCLGRISAGGSTNLFGALMAALAGGDPLRPTTGYDCDEIFVLTDGEPSAGAVQDADGILQIVADVNRYRRVRIHTVHVGGDAGLDLMRRLAAENQGVFVDR